MAINRQGRLLLRNSLLGYMDGQYSCRVFERQVWAGMELPDGKDNSLRGIADFLWTTYDDLKEHTIDSRGRVHPETWAALCRTQAFLASDLELAEFPFSHHRKLNKKRWEEIETFWPFHSQDQADSFRQQIDNIDPQFDSALVQKDRNDVESERRSDKIGVTILGLTLLFFVIVTVLAILCRH